MFSFAGGMESCHQAMPKDAAATDAHVLFTGICTFLRQPGNPVVAAIPRIDQPRLTNYLDQNHKPMTIPIHRAFIVIDTSQNKFTATVPYTSVGQYAVIWLKDEEIKVDHAVGNPFTWGESDTSGVPCPPLQTQPDKYFNSVPKLSNLCNTGGPPALYDPTVTVHMDVGATKAYVISEEISDFKASLTGIPVRGQRIAQVVDWRVPLVQGATSLDLVHKTGGSYVKLVSIEPNSSGQIVAVIGSAAEKDLRDALEGRCASLHPDVDHHFEVYFDLCVDTMQYGKPIPHLSQQPCSHDAIDPVVPGWLNPKCIAGSVNCGPDQWP